MSALVLALSAACSTGTGPEAFDAPIVPRAGDEICDTIDNDLDGLVDESCTDCDWFVTRDKTWWLSNPCVVGGAATGYPLVPITLGTSTVLSTAADVQAVLRQSIAGDVTIGLEIMLLVDKLNVAAFQIGDLGWDQDGDGLVDTTVNDFLAQADAIYDNRAALSSGIVRNWAFDLKDLSNAGTHLPAWFDETCATPGELCNGLDDDGDGTVDENCLCEALPPVDYATEVQPILDANCAVAGCHDAATATLGLDLSAGASWGNLVGVPAVELSTMDRVAPGDPDASYLWHKLNDTQGSVGGSGGFMPPSGILDATDLDTVERWILEGANP